MVLSDSAVLYTLTFCHMHPDFLSDPEKHRTDSGGEQTSSMTLPRQI